VKWVSWWGGSVGRRGAAEWRKGGVSMHLTYQFQFRDGSSQRISVDLQRPVVAPDAAAGAWTRLGHHQCPNCPLKADAHPHCPPAVDLAPTIAAFARIISHERAQVLVETPERVIGKECQVQQALGSLVGVIMATSGCPILGRMRGLALTHLPFATPEEALLRSVGTYLVSQLLQQKRGAEPDWALDGLKGHYADLEQLNRAFKQRIASAAQEDAAINAVSAFGVLSMSFGISIEDHLPELVPFAVQGAALP
jgi:hypothetical protein